MSVAAIQARLVSTELFSLVGGAAEFGAAADTAPPEPAAFVLLLGDDGNLKVPFTTGMQRITRMYGVLLCVRNVADAAGAGAGTDLTALRKGVFDQLIGWMPFDGAEPLQFAKGRLLKFDAGLLWWQDDFMTTFFTSRPEAWA